MLQQATQAITKENELKSLKTKGVFCAVQMNYTR